MANSKFLLNETEQNLPYVLFYDDAGGYVPSHWHKEMELIMCKCGRTKMAINNKTYELEEGDIAVVPGGDTHLYFRAQNHVRLVLLFDYELFDPPGIHGAYRTELKRRLKNLPRISRYWSAESVDRVKIILEELEELNTSKVFGRDLAIRARMFELILLLCNYVAVEKVCEPEKEKGRATQTPEDTQATERLANLEKIFNYVEQNYQKPITLQDAADVLGFTSSYFARFFKKYSGETFLSYLNAFRINKARDMLFMEKYSITRISEEVGIPNVKTFNRLFKQLIGASPLQYRKSIFGPK